MRVLVLLSACVAAALAHGAATAQPAAITGTGAEAVRTEPTLRAGASIAVGERHGRGGGLGGGLGGRYGRGWGRGLGFGRFGGGWVYPGAMEQVVVAQPADYGYGMGGYGGGYYGAGYGGVGTTYVQQPPQVVVAQPPQVVVAEQQPPQVVYTQAAPPETTIVPSSTFVASAAPAAGGYAAGGYMAAGPASTTSVSTTTATQPGASGYIATAAAPSVVASAAPTVVAAAPSASYVTAESLVPGLQYASPYFFGAGSPVVYSRYLGGPTSWYGLRGSRFGRRFGRGVFGVYPYGYGSGGMMYTMGGGGILGNILGGVTGGIVPPIYVGGRIGFGGGRFGGGRVGRGRRHLETQPQTTGATQGQPQALHQVGDVQSLQSPQVVYTQAAPPETAIVPGSTFVAAAAPAVGNAQSLPITGKTGEPAPAPAPAEPQKPQALKSLNAQQPMGFKIVDVSDNIARTSWT